MSYKGFSTVELKKPGRSTFDLSHEKRVSSRMGKLTPIFITETLPNDTFRGSTEVSIKFAPILAPIYQRLNLFVHFFFVPNRLLWKDWETFITGGRLGAAVTSPPVPPRARIDLVCAANLDLLDQGSLADYLGIPNIPDAEGAAWGARTIDMMPFNAIYRCWYDYYRDRNYQDDNDYLPMVSSTTLNYVPMYTRYRAWQHDYFTSALPFTQRGNEVLIPMEGSGNIVYKNISTVLNVDTSTGADTTAIGAHGGDAWNEDEDVALRFENLDSVEFENSTVSVNDLRRATMLQVWLERNALAGSRYTESNMAHFARRSSDARLQRAEYLGGGKAVIQVDEVMTTAYSTDNDNIIVPPANYSGRARAYANTNRFNYNCEEHGFIIGILSVMPTSGYMQGFPRMFQQRNTFLEYPWPTFAHLGEQEVYDYEIYADPSTVQIDRTTAPVFGYQSRYSDWKFIQSSSHGDFRNSLDFWHLTRKFSEVPNLGASFVTFEDELQDRIFAVAESDTMWMYVYNNVKVKRSLPYFGTPQL